MLKRWEASQGLSAVDDGPAVGAKLAQKAWSSILLDGRQRSHAASTSDQPGRTGGWLVWSLLLPLRTENAGLEIEGSMLQAHSLYCVHCVGVMM